MYTILHYDINNKSTYKNNNNIEIVYFVILCSYLKIIIFFKADDLFDTKNKEITLNSKLNFYVNLTKKNLRKRNKARAKG